MVRTNQTSIPPLLSRNYKGGRTPEERRTHPDIPLGDQDVMALKKREVPRCIKAYKKQKPHAVGHHKGEPSLKQVRFYYYFSNAHFYQQSAWADSQF